MAARWKILGSIIVVAAITSAAWYWYSTRPRNHLRAADGATSVTVIDTANPFAFEPPPPGWRHRQFTSTPPMQLSFVEKDGIAAIRCETLAGGSIYGRHTDIDVSRFSELSWKWHVEVPITGGDERTREGDDHPVRFFIEFRDTDRGAHRMEIIWSNGAFQRGEWKYIGTFPHYVADGGAQNVGRWRDERADLLDIYRVISKRSDVPRLTFFGLFCDSDGTGSRSVAYTTDVQLRTKRSQP